jgi:RimJ/RimL family protein N-acetyltransferase
MSKKRKEINKLFEIRDFNMNDLEDYQIALNSSKEHLELYLDWGKQATEYDSKHCKYILEQMIKDKFPRKNYAIVFKGKVVGEISFGEASRHDGLQITYWLSKNYIGKGLCIRALAKLVEKSYQYDGINFLEIHVDQANLASANVAKKAGFIYYDSYQYSTNATLGSGVMDVYILLTPRASLQPHILNSTNLSILDLTIKPVSLNNSEANELVNTGLQAQN